MEIFPEMRLTNPIAAAALLAALAFASPGLAGEEPHSTMTIPATGTVSAEPDQAQIVFGVHSTGEEARQAMRLNAARMERAFSELEKAGVAPRDIVTTALSLNPRYESYSRGDGNTPPRIRGYEAHNNVTVTVRDIDRLGEVLDSLVGAGVNGIDTVRFGISDTAGMEKAARIEAAQKARAKAETYAGAIGTEITGILSISETGHATPRPYAAMEMMKADPAGRAIPVAGGEMDISVSLSVVFSLEGGLK